MSSDSRLLIRASEARLGSFPIYYAVGLSGLRRQRERLMDVLGERIAAFARPAGERRERAEALLVLLQIEAFVTHVAGAGDSAETDRGVTLLTEQILRSGDGDSGTELFDQWVERNGEAVKRSGITLSEIQEGERFDLATLSVALRSFRGLIH